jgi:outer membrane murein-binding lipoprotein Lpp
MEHRINTSHNSKLEELRKSLSKGLLDQSSKFEELTSKVNDLSGKVSEEEHDIKTVQNLAYSAQQAQSSASSSLGDIKGAH